MSDLNPLDQVIKKPFKCKICSISFSEEFTLLCHRKVHLKTKTSSPDMEYKKKFGHGRHISYQNNGAIQENKPFKAKRHSELTDPKAVKVQGDSGKTLEDKKNVLNISNICLICGKEMSSKNNLVRHIKTHTGEKTFKCSFCPSTFALSQSMKIHERIHTGKRPYECLVCGKAFRISGTLSRHLRTHTGERLYQCNLCPKAFTALQSLKDHKNVHTGARPYSCKTCGKTFARSSNLVSHVKIHTRK